MEHSAGGKPLPPPHTESYSLASVLKILRAFTLLFSSKTSIWCIYL